MGSTPPTNYVPAFQGALSSGGRLEASRLASSPSLREWDLGVRSKILKIVSRPETVDSLDWDSPTKRRSLVGVQQALLDAWEDDSLSEWRADSSSAILKHLDRCCRLWSDQFKSWHWDSLQRSGFDSERAYRAEVELRAALARLPTFLGQEVSNRYTLWVELCGGWNTGGDNAGVSPPLPSWLRRWATTEYAARGLDLAQVVSLHAFTRWSQRLLEPAPEGDDATALGPNSLTELTRLNSMVSELYDLCSGQRLLPGADFEGSATQTQAHPPQEAGPQFPRSMIVRGDRTVPLHPDHQKALRVVLSAYYVWRADVEYRRIGPARFGKTIDQGGAARAKRLYGGPSNCWAWISPMVGRPIGWWAWVCLDACWTSKGRSSKRSVGRDGNSSPWDKIICEMQPHGPARSTWTTRIRCKSPLMLSSRSNQDWSSRRRDLTLKKA